MGTKEAGHTSTASNEGEREKIHKFPHELAGKINASTCSLSSHPLPRASAKTTTQPEPTNPLCVRCSWVNESALHALWSCGELDAIWEDLNMWSCRNTLSFITIKELLSWLINHQHHLEFFSVTAWSIWTQRNQVRLNQPNCSLHLITLWQRNDFGNFKMLIRTLHLLGQPIP